MRNTNPKQTLENILKVPNKTESKLEKLKYQLRDLWMDGHSDII